MHKDIRINLGVSGIECDDCMSKRLRKLFDTYEGTLVSRKGDYLTVNWQVFSKVKSDGEKQTKMATLLMALEVFSFSSAGNWEVVSNGLLLNPRHGTFTVFFTREQDVKSFAKFEFANTAFGWEVRQIGKVFSKRQVMDFVIE